MSACNKKETRDALDLIKSGKSNPGQVMKSTGETALIIACRNSLSDVALALINTGESNPGQADYISGSTALILACNNRLTTVAVALIYTGQSKPEHVNRLGDSAIRIARRNDLNSVLKALTLPVIEKPDKINLSERLENTIENKFPIERRFDNVYKSFTEHEELKPLYDILFSLGNYTQPMINAIKYYGSAIGYKKINTELMNQAGETYINPNKDKNSALPSVIQLDPLSSITQLDDAFKNAAPRVSKQIVTFRGTYTPYEKLINVGDTQISPTYISTSRHISTAMQFSNIQFQQRLIPDACCLYIFIIPPGMPYIDFLSLHNAGVWSGELEVLLPRNLILKYEGDVLIDPSKFGYLGWSQSEVLSYKCEVASSIKELQKEVGNLAILNEMDLSKLEEPIKNTLSSTLMLNDEKHSVNTLSPENMYKIKVLSVHAQPDNIYGITGGKIKNYKTKKQRRNKKRGTKRYRK